MHLNPALVRQPRVISSSLPRPRASRGVSPQVCEEIHAYIAARDMALAEAERAPSDLTLNRAFLANQMVDNCLKPARSPYQAQSLPEADAVRERQRCERAKTRIAQLRAGTSRLFACAVAA